MGDKISHTHTKKINSKLNKNSSIENKTTQALKTDGRLHRGTNETILEETGGNGNQYHGKQPTERVTGQPTDPSEKPVVRH